MSTTLSQPAAPPVDVLLASYAQDMRAELTRITDFWLAHTLDERRGGFIGQMDSAGEIDAQADKGSILNARILWTFSAAYRHTGEATHLAAATRAFEYLLAHFIDNEHGGIYWLVGADGQPLNTRKQIYALAFAIYGLSEYYRATGNPRLCRLASSCLSG